MIDNSIQKNILRALSEDKIKQDKTTALFIRQSTTGKAVILAKEPGILCGIELARFIFKTVDKNLKVETFFEDGKKINKEDKILSVEGSLQAILRAERVCINFLSLTSGVSTVTNAFVRKAKKSKVVIKDTRKTIPGLRRLQKYAVSVGGGKNHRSNLSGGIIIKDNHLRAAGAIDRKNNINHKNFKRLWQGLRRKTKLPIEVEVETFKEFKQIIKYKPDIIMLDNFSRPDLKKASAYRNRYFPQIELEASGRVTLDNIGAVASTGVDSVSVGSITHSPSALDFSLEICKV